MAISQVAYGLLKSQVKGFVLAGMPRREIFLAFRSQYWRQFHPSALVRQAIPGLKFYHVARMVAECRHEAGIKGRGSVATREASISKDILIPRAWPEVGMYGWKVKIEGRTDEGKWFEEYRWFKTRRLPKSIAQVEAKARKKFVTKGGYFRGYQATEAWMGKVYRVQFMQGSYGAPSASWTEDEEA